jgi:hypothetical protein
MSVPSSYFLVNMPGKVGNIFNPTEIIQSLNSSYHNLPDSVIDDLHSARYNYKGYRSAFNHVLVN